MNKLTKKERAEIFQLAYDLHYKMWDKMIDYVINEDTLQLDIIDLKNTFKIVNVLKMNCFGCELAKEECSKCFLKFKLNCFNADSWFQILNDGRPCNKQSIPLMKKIRDCGWKDNSKISDYDLIDFLIKLGGKHG